MRQKHGLLLFIATCIPGCGQMHQGYMKRGVSLLLAFCGILVLAILLNLGELCIFLPLVWLYAFFDSYNLRARMADGVPQEDDFLFGLSDMDSEKLAQLCRKRHSLIGWVLVLLGLYLLYRTVMSTLWSVFGRWGWLYDLMVYDLPRLASTLVILALGLWFLRGPRHQEAEEDIPDFVPPGGSGAAKAAPYTWDAPTAPDVPVIPTAPEQEAPHGDQ